MCILYVGEKITIQVGILSTCSQTHNALFYQLIS